MSQFFGLSKARQLESYASSDLSKAAIDFRKAENIGRRGNVTVIEYQINNRIIVECFHSVGARGRHSEFIARDALTEHAVLKRLFTERQPCTLLIPNCDKMLAEQFPDAEITFLVEYGNAASRQRGNAALETLLEALGL